MVGLIIKMKYNIIYADPPWKYTSKTPEECLKIDGFRAPEKYYPTMETQDIVDLPIKELANDDCILFIWATYPKLKDVFEVIEGWEAWGNQVPIETQVLLK